jgi:dynein intermediate chain 2
MDGVLDFWDIFYRQNAVAYSHKVADHPLSSISVQGTAQSGGGRLIAVGDVNGTVSLLEVSENLAVPPASEKVRPRVLLLLVWGAAASCASFV